MTNETFIENYNKLKNEILDCLRNNRSIDYLNLDNNLILTAKELLDSILVDIENNNFKMVYQPHAISNHLSDECETFFRYNTHDISINPEVFFFLAREASKMNDSIYHDLEKNILHKQLEIVCQDTKEFVKHFGENYRTCINVNPHLFNDELYDYYKKLMDKYNLNGSNIAIELLESSSFDTVNPETFTKFQSLGTLIYLDDFGTSYAKFPLLHKFNFDFVKIDAKYIRDIHQNKRMQRFISKLISYCNRLGMQVVAEGVETIQELKTLLSFGDVEIQGYIVSKPLDKEALISHFSEINDHYTKIEIKFNKENKEIERE